jgi:hypothetical protein
MHKEITFRTSKEAEKITISFSFILPSTGTKNAYPTNSTDQSPSKTDSRSTW